MTDGGRKRKPPPELSDRHAAIADKAGEAARRGWALQSKAGHCSQEAAAAYHEAGRALLELQGECSRGELKLARARAGVSTDRAARLRRLADAWPTPLDLYLAFPRSIGGPFYGPDTPPEAEADAGAGKPKARKPKAELSDRHADLADKAGAADRRAQRQHVEAGLLSIEAAESYLEAGALSNELSQECSRGELMLARRRAGLTAKRSRKLMQLANDWHGCAPDLYAAFNRTTPFRTEGEARRWRDDMAADDVEVLIESREDWQARTRGLVDDAQTSIPGRARTARWFGTFYTGQDRLLEAESLAELGAEGQAPQGGANMAAGDERRRIEAHARNQWKQIEGAPGLAWTVSDARNPDPLREGDPNPQGAPLAWWALAIVLGCVVVAAAMGAFG